jgi:hypothetical protein
VAFALLTLGAGPALAARVSYKVGPISDVSAAMRGQNAKVEQAVDQSGSYVYEEWIGSNAIGFARSTDGGRHFRKPITLRASAGGWDPALAVAPNGTVYAAFMVTRGTKSFPVVVSSFDHGASFTRVTSLVPSRKNNWGDREFIAVAPNNDVYVTWDYGPSSPAVKVSCPANGSCGFTAGDMNIVIQTSTNRGKSFGPMERVSPGFPAGGADSAPLVVEPNGQIDVLYQGYRVTRRRGYRLGRGSEYFTSSNDGGQSWTPPIKLGRSAGTIAVKEWWIDGALGIDAAGNLYATWDTQGRGGDIGWLSYSTDHGTSWSSPIRVSVDAAKVAHIVEAAGASPGVVYVAWLSDRRPRGYAEYLRPFSIAHGWLAPARRISRRFGDLQVWPGDTFGITTVSPTEVFLSWGSAVRGTHGDSEIFVAPVKLTLPEDVSVS